MRYLLYQTLASCLVPLHLHFSLLERGRPARDLSYFDMREVRESERGSDSHLSPPKLGKCPEEEEKSWRRMEGNTHFGLTVIPLYCDTIGECRYGHNNYCLITPENVYKVPICPRGNLLYKQVYRGEI